MARNVLVVVGVGGMGQAIARRIGAGKTLVLADNNQQTLGAVADALRLDGHHVETHHLDVSAADSVHALARSAGDLGPVTQLAHTAGLSPSQAPTDAVLAVDLLGVALVLDEFAEVIATGGAGVVIASMAGHMFPPLTRDEEQALAHTPASELLQLPFIKDIKDPGMAYGIAKQGNYIRVRAASKTWGRRGARVNSISPGIISTPMGQHELASPLGEGMRMMLDASAAGRIGTPEDIAAATAFLLGDQADFITGTDLLVDGGVTAAMKSA
jgi:NAD(P)-dependent dehydrogenase (short-subunit alcohol dehydrogenase family)